MIVIVFGLHVAAGREMDDDARTLYMNTGLVDTNNLERLPLRSLITFEKGKSYVIQLKAPMTRQIRTVLQSAGVRLMDYLPRNAYIVELGGVSPEVLAEFEFVQWAGEYQKDWKLEPNLGGRQFVTSEREALTIANRVVVTVTLFQGKTSMPTLETIGAVEGAVVHTVEEVGGNEVITVTLPNAAVPGLADMDDVQYVEEYPELTYRNGTARWIVQSNQTDVTPLYDHGLRGEGQIVGVLDGPPDQRHCSLDEGKILFYNAPDGNDFHGTHVVCTIAGENSELDDTRGVAFLANMVFSTPPDLAEGSLTLSERLRRHHNQGARIHANSWGNDATNNYDALCRGFDAFLYEHEEDFACVAATNLGTLKNPENAKNLLVVGASRDTPEQDSYCSGGVGPTADGRLKPDVCAPGCEVMSAAAGTQCGVGPMTGTSVAASTVAGVAALVRQYFVDGYYPGGKPDSTNGFVPSGALIKAAMINSAVDMDRIGNYPSEMEGWGRILAGDVLYFAGDDRKLAVLADIRNQNGMDTGNRQTFEFQVRDMTERLKVTLVWTDPPASVGTGTCLALVNNLDLEVTSPAGKVYLGNDFFKGVSKTGGVADALNNVEQVHLNEPHPGIWKATVKAATVNVPNQGFALLATGNFGVGIEQEEQEYEQEHEQEKEEALIVMSQEPPAGSILGDLNEIWVTFSEPVKDVTADQLRVNGSSAVSLEKPLDASQGSVGPYRFSGFEVPDRGTVQVTFASGVVTNDADNVMGDSSWTYEMSDCEADRPLTQQDILAGVAQDCNGNMIPDLCDPDMVQADAGANRTMTTGEVLTLGGDTAARGGSPPYLYEWTLLGEFGDERVADANPTFNPTLPGVYVVKLEVTDASGCSSTALTEVRVVDNSVDRPPSTTIDFTGYFKSCASRFMISGSLTLMVMVVGVLSIRGRRRHRLNCDQQKKAGSRSLN